MRILLVNVNAQSGSTGKIVTDIKSVLESRGHECLVAYGANETVAKPGYMRICSEFERKFNALISRFTGVRHGYFLPFSFWRLKSLFNKWNPDIVHLHCPNGYILDLFKTLDFLAKNNIKTVVTNHAEYWYTGGCAYAYDCVKWISGCADRCLSVRGILPVKSAQSTWRGFKKAFDSFNPRNIIVTSVSKWVEDRAKTSPALKRFKNVTVLNGIDTSVFHIYDNIDESIKNRLPVGKPVALHVTASFSLNPADIKGGCHLIELAKSMPDVNFVVVSMYSDVNQSQLPGNVFLYGRASDQKELACLYNLADVTVLVSKRETFSMIVAESLCCGTPVVGFKAGGPETIAIPQYSRFVNYGDILQLKDAISDKMTRKSESEVILNKSHAVYSKDIMTSNYINLYNSFTS